MRKSTFWFFILLLIGGSISWASPVPQQAPTYKWQEEEADENTPRGYFLVTRKNHKPTPTRKTGQPVAAPKKVPSTSPQGTSPVTEPNSTSRPALLEPGAIGIGVTLYQDKENEGAVRVSTSKTFFDGDKVRFVIETNTEGFLYVFQSENNHPPKMVFPDYRVKHGANRIDPHVPYEVPSRWGDYDWFAFQVKEPATLRLYFVVSREPLGDIPTNQRLAEYCKGEECAWKPSSKEFEPVLAGAGEKKLTHEKDVSQKALTSAENEKIDREIKLVKRELEPGVVYVNSSAKSNILVVTTDLSQKPRP